jgi:hypothetical protein
MFFECDIAKAIWCYVRDFLGIDIESVAAKWLHKEKFYVPNTISTAVLRGMWLIRNDCVQ